MSDYAGIFEGAAGFDPSADLEAFLKAVPAKWVVYLMADAQDQPVQLLCVKNLRASLKRRLGGEEMVGPSKRVNYRELVRRIHWRRVDSPFEADWIYLEAARRVFPESYRGMVGFRPAWFIHVNPEAKFPRYTKTTDLAIKSGVLAGPVEDKHAAARLIQAAEDCFDLCRYYNILVEAPHGKACAYKEMGKCPAPCDGSISMDRYRAMVDASLRTIVGPGEYVREQTRQMQAAAASLQFEQAGKIKAKLDLAAQFGQGAFRHARRLEDFAFLALQRGPRQGSAKAFLITPGQIEEVAALIDEPQHPADLLRYVLERGLAQRGAEMDEEGAERVAIVSHHLFSPKQAQGVFLRLDEVEEKGLLKAFRELRKQKVVEAEEGEGILRELQAVGEPPPGPEKPAL